eukprot:g5289.t1
MKKICVILIFVVWCVGAMEGGTDVSAFHDDPDEIASPVIEKSSDPKQAFAMLRGKKSDNVLSLQGMGKNVGQEDKTEALFKGKKQGKGMDAEKAKALFEGGGDLTKSEESTECLNPRSSVVALVLEISMTPILERFYLGYRTGPWFAFILAAFFGLYFFCINGRWCDPIFSYMGSKMKTDDEVQTAAFFKTCGFVTTVTAAIFAVCCVLWAIIDFGMIVTGHMIDADGCPLTGL